VAINSSIPSSFDAVTEADDDDEEGDAGVFKKFACDENRGELHTRRAFAAADETNPLEDSQSNVGNRDVDASEADAGDDVANVNDEEEADDEEEEDEEVEEEDEAASKLDSELVEETGDDAVEKLSGGMAPSKPNEADDDIDDAATIEL
jgi:hypothetical protein